MKKIALLATLHGRIEGAKAAIKSIAPQVDIIEVTLNKVGDEDVSGWAWELSVVDNIRFLESNNELGDAERYLTVKAKPTAYYLTIDDDIIYPPSYVEYLTSQCERYGCYVSLHGRRFHGDKIDKYYFGQQDVYRCLGLVSHDTEVQVPGTGVSCWRSDMIDLRYKQFKGKNRADIEVARIAAERGAKIMVLAHTPGWLRYREPKTPTIHDMKCMDCGEETREMNKVLRLLKRKKENKQ